MGCIGVLFGFILKQSLNELLSAITVGKWDIESFDQSPANSFIKVIWSVCCSNDQDASFFSGKGVRSIKLYQELRLDPTTTFLLVVTPRAQQGIDLIDEDHRWLVDSSDSKHGSNHLFAFTDPL